MDPNELKKKEIQLAAIEEALKFREEELEKRIDELNEREYLLEQREEAIQKKEKDFELISEEKLQQEKEELEEKLKEKEKEYLEEEVIPDHVEDEEAEDQIQGEPLSDEDEEPQNVQEEENIPIANNAINAIAEKEKIEINEDPQLEDEVEMVPDVETEETPLDLKEELKGGKPEVDLLLVNPTMENIEAIPASAKKTENLNEAKYYQMPNAMVGKPYEVGLNELRLEDDMVVEEIIGLEANGLEYIKMESLIQGTPLEEGELVFDIKFSFDGLDDDFKLGEKKLRLLINPDPRSLWKDKPPPADALFFKENEASAQLKYKEYHVVGASKRGRSHAHEGIFRDDHFHIEKLDNDWLFVAVADGAGSCKYSREGSKIACETTCTTVKNILDVKGNGLDQIIGAYAKDGNDLNVQKVLKRDLYQIIGQGVVQARNAIVEKSKAEGHEIRDYSTTLIFALLKKFDFGCFITTYAVGDGAVALHKNEEYVDLMMTPDGGEFAGQTRFIVMSEIVESEDIWKRIHFALNDDFTSLFLMTDGVSDPKFETDAQLMKSENWDEFYKDLTNEITFGSDQQAEQLSNWLDFWSQGNHDDRTIVILTK